MENDGSCGISTAAYLAILGRDRAGCLRYEFVPAWASGTVASPNIFSKQTPVNHETHYALIAVV